MQLFTRTSLSSKLVTYCAAGLPVIVDGPADSVVWKLVDRHKAGILLRNEVFGEVSADDADEMRLLLNDSDRWQTMAEGSRRLCEGEFNMDANIRKFREFLDESVLIGARRNSKGCGMGCGNA